MDLVQIATCEIACILDRLLPAESTDWWNELVWNNLNDNQRDLIQTRSNPTLQDLDLASLLSVVDANWSRFGDTARNNREARNYLMELRTIRNQLCHRTSRPTPVETSLRQWQTLKLCLKSLGGSESAIRLIDVQLLRLTKSYQSELTKGPRLMVS